VALSLDDPPARFDAVKRRGVTDKGVILADLSWGKSIFLGILTQTPALLREFHHPNKKQIPLKAKKGQNGKVRLPKENFI
jgi:hypothetical protein